MVWILERVQREVKEKFQRRKYFYLEKDANRHIIEIMESGTLESNELIHAAYNRLRNGENHLMVSYSTVDGHSCRAVMSRAGDIVKILSRDTTIARKAVGDE